MSTQGYARGVSDYYGYTDIGATILDALRAAGKDLNALTPGDLAPVDQFHTRGSAATGELIELAGLQGGERVLDVGGGLGGPARALAAGYNCNVTVLDLTERYCLAGEELTRLTHLSDRVRFHHGSALEMPFDDGDFDVVWAQNSSMNVADKERLHSEVHRVLRSGGTFALQEIMAGPVQPAYYPAPWAADESISFLEPPAEARDLLRRLGFEERAWVDVSAPALESARARDAAIAGQPLPPLGMHLLLGPAFADVYRNQVRSLEEQRIAIIQAVLTR